MKRAIILMLDSFGIGATPDADQFGDACANTLGHIAQACARGECDQRAAQYGALYGNTVRTGALHIPNLTALGLARANADATGQFPSGLDSTAEIIGAFGHAAEISSGKDTPSGHWEMAGVPVLFDWGYFHDTTNSFPQELLDRIVARAQLPGYLGNCHSSGTVILDELGEKHIRTGKPIFYTSVDSVFQIAAHEGHFGLERLYELCQIAREELNDYNIGRVIARPFIGERVGEFERTGNRHDYAVEPPAPTVLQKLVEERGGDVVSIGKIADIYANMGITQQVKATGLPELFDATLNAVRVAQDNTIVFTNFVDFDSSYGHRRNVAGYAVALEYIDARLPELYPLLNENDIVVLTADHGCDPTWRGTDHTREHVPVLLYGKKISPRNLGARKTFADIGQTLASYFGTTPMNYGTNLLEG